MNKEMKKTGILCDHLYGCSCSVGSKQCPELEIFVEKAKAELLSKIEGEVDEIETQIFVAETEGDVVPVIETSGYKKALKDVKSILSKYKTL